MQLITKQEANFLRENGFSNKIKKSHTSHAKYYVVEDFKYKYELKGKYQVYDEEKGEPIDVKPCAALAKLYEYRKNNIVYSSNM